LGEHYSTQEGDVGGEFSQGSRCDIRGGKKIKVREGKRSVGVNVGEEGERSRGAKAGSRLWEGRRVGR
jgi:hypothetical protein